MPEIINAIFGYLAIVSLVCGFLSMAAMGPWVMIRIDLSDRVAIPVDLFMATSLCAMSAVLIMI